jgi:hypothetical protein
MEHPPISIRSILFIRHISTRGIYRLLLCHSQIAINAVRLRCSLVFKKICEQQLSFQTSPPARPWHVRKVNTTGLMSVSTGFSWLWVWLQIVMFTYLHRPHGVIQTLLCARIIHSAPLYPISLLSIITFT